MSDRLNLGSTPDREPTPDLDPRVQSIIENAKTPEAVASAATGLQLDVFCSIDNSLYSIDRSLNAIARFCVKRGIQEKIFDIDEFSDLFSDGDEDDDE